jgi:hypothetical protein
MRLFEAIWISSLCVRKLHVRALLYDAVWARRGSRTYQAEQCRLAVVTPAVSSFSFHSTDNKVSGLVKQAYRLHCK